MMEYLQWRRILAAADDLPPRGVGLNELFLARKRRAGKVVRRAANRVPIGTFAQGYAGIYYITCRSTQQPDLYGPDKKRLDIEAAKKLFYAGCKVAVITTPWAYAKQGNRGVSADLLAVKFLGHGDAFSGRPVVDASDLPDVDPADLDPGDFTAGAPVRATEPDPTDNCI